MADRRIVFDARYVNDRYHGIGRYAFSLLAALLAENRPYRFVVVRGRGVDSRFDWRPLALDPRVELVEGPWPLYWPHEQWEWPRLLRQWRADLYHSPYFVAPLLTSVPSIITVHDLIFDRYPAYMPKAWSRPYYRLLMRLGTRHAERVVAVSDATVADLQKFYCTPDHKITTITEGADPAFCPPEDRSSLESIRVRYGLERPFVLAVGARRPHKNYTALVEAYAQLPAGDEHDLVFVGPPDTRFPDEARAAVGLHRLDGRVHFVDWVPEADLPGLYAAADLVVVPSLIEGFGLPALEAMCCGTAVLAADTSSLPEVVGDAGALFDPHDAAALPAALTELLHDPARRSRLAAAGLQRAATFTWQQAARATLKVYQELLA